MDYYQILELKRNATDIEIAKAQRRLALKFHPKKFNNNDQNAVQKHFNEINESQEVLSDQKYKGIYDYQGEAVLKEGMHTEKEFIGGYRYIGNADKIFENFFGTNNPFFDITDPLSTNEAGSMFGKSYGGLNSRPLKGPPNVEMELACTLLELFMGSRKSIQIRRRILNKDGKSTREIEEDIVVTVPKGIRTDSKIVFNERGNDEPGHKPSDLIFTVKEIEHNEQLNFNRKDDDLIQYANITLLQALSSEPLYIKHLDGRTLSLAFDEVVNPTSSKLIKNEGFYVYDENMHSRSTLRQADELPRGDLIVRFNINFPKSLSVKKREELKKILS